MLIRCFHGVFFAACREGTYGINCTKLCGQCADWSDCDSVTGVCKLGCQPGWYGERCDKSKLFLIITVCGLNANSISCTNNLYVMNEMVTFIYLYKRTPVFISFLKIDRNFKVHFMIMITIMTFASRFYISAVKGLS